MPPVLERCVLRLTGRGASQSQAFAICTAALQRSGRLPRGQNASTDNGFGAWATAVKLPRSLERGFSKYWLHLPARDVNLLRRIRRVYATDREGVFGFARLHSGEFHVNPAAIQRHGNAPLWYAAVAIHEAVHAVYGFGEHEATHTEQRLAGHHFGVGQIRFRKPEMALATRVAFAAQAQRESDVVHGHRSKDLFHLVEVGFTQRVGRRIIRLGQEAFRVMQRRRAQAGAKTLDIDFSDFDEPLTKTVNDAFEELLDEAITKTVGSEVYAPLRARFGAPPSTSVQSGNPSPGFSPTIVGRLIEGYVRRAARRGLMCDTLLPGGLMPELRKVGYDPEALPEEWQERREEALRDLIPKLADEGLFDDEDEPTEAHLMALMHGWSPVMGELLERG